MCEWESANISVRMIVCVCVCATRARFVYAPRICEATLLSFPPIHFAPPPPTPLRPARMAGASHTARVTRVGCAVRDKGTRVRAHSVCVLIAATFVQLHARTRIKCTHTHTHT